MHELDVEAAYNTIEVGRNMLVTLEKGLDMGVMQETEGAVDVCQNVIGGALYYINRGLEDMHKELEAAEKEEQPKSKE